MEKKLEKGKGKALWRAPSRKRLILGRNIFSFGRGGVPRLEDTMPIVTSYSSPFDTKFHDTFDTLTS